MKKINTIFKYTMALTLMVFMFQACGGDNDPVDLNIVSMTVDGSDLNGAVSPGDVASDASIVITFNSDIKAETATPGNITLVQDYDDTNIELTITVDGPMLTIQPTSTLGSGTLYSFTISMGLLNTDDQPLASTARTFTTEGTFSPSGMIANWTFEDTSEDIVGSYDPAASAIVDITYTDSRNADAGLAATFNGNTSIIEIPNGDQLVDTEEFTLSFWVKTNSDGHVNENDDPTGHFVMGLAAFFGFQFEIGGGYDFLKMPNWIALSDGSTRGGGDLFWNGDGKTRDNDGWQGTTFNDVEDITTIAKDKWMQVAFVFNGPEKTRSMYVNGELRITHDFSLWPEDATERLVTGMAYGGAEPETYPELAFGFVQSRAGTLWDAEPWGGYDIPTSQHFKGQLDDIKVYHKVLTDTEIQLMYTSEN